MIWRVLLFASAATALFPRTLIMNAQTSENSRHAPRADTSPSHQADHAEASHFDFIVCGAGSSGSVVAARLAERSRARVLLIEAGGSDDVPEVTTPGQWPLNLGSERDWGFSAQPNPHLNGRQIPLNLGKVLGGGSSINVMVWARGHKIARWSSAALACSNSGTTMP
jgi:choline dehydrogenase